MTREISFYEAEGREPRAEGEASGALMPSFLALSSPLSALGSLLRQSAVRTAVATLSITASTSSAEMISGGARAMPSLLARTISP